MISLDLFDRRILAALQQDGRMTSVALADLVHLSASQCARRVQRLEEAGVIRSYRAVLDPAALGLGISGVVSLSLETHANPISRSCTARSRRGRRSSNAWR
jgi:Lrp/AsnC family leucine-responsive transcriptional regulator